MNPLHQQKPGQLPADHLHVELAKKALERVIIHSSISDQFDFVVNDQTGVITVIEKGDSEPISEVNTR